MALVHSEVGVFTISTVDDDGAKGAVTFFGKLPAINQWTQVAIDKTKELLWGLLSPLMGAALRGISFGLGSYDDTYPVAAAGSDVENKGVWLMTAAGNVKADFATPDILETKLVSSGALTGIQIDFTDADVIAFNDALINGIDLNPFGVLDVVQFGTSRGELFVQIRDAYKQNRKSHKSRGGRG